MRRKDLAMRSKYGLRWIAAAAILLGGCVTARQYPAPPLWLPSQLVESGGRPGETGVAAAASDSQGRPIAPRNVLVLSGGGMNGAYSAGVLKGWTASGTRPPFDVVTGISTGALIAPFAFLGPEYDAELERLYTSMRRENIFRPRLLWLDSIASSEPLEKQIAASATAEILQKIAAAHRQGRRLYVGTTNLDTKKPVVWDLGAIAARNSAESRTLIQKVLLASCSVPGLLPPVAIDVEIDGKRFTELHADGGITASVFLQPQMVGIGPNGEVPSDAAGLSVRVIVAGTLHPTATPTKLELLSISSESVNAMLQSKLEGDLTQLFLIARYARADFKVAGVGQDRCRAASNSMSFDQQFMRALFDDGFQGGKDGTAWRSTPPGLEKSQIPVPRCDTRFASVRGTPSPDSWTPEKIRITLDDGAAANPQRGATLGSPYNVRR
jgi:hypothetical protein